MNINKLFEELYVKNAPTWSIERDPDGHYKYHATQSALTLFEQQQLEVESLKVDLAKANTVPEGFVLVPFESLKVALVWMNEDIDPWQMGGDTFADLFEHKPILEKALVNAQEQNHESK